MEVTVNLSWHESYVSETRIGETEVGSLSTSCLQQLCSYSERQLRTDSTFRECVAISVVLAPSSMPCYINRLVHKIIESSQDHHQPLVDLTRILEG